MAGKRKKKKPVAPAISGESGKLDIDKKTLDKLAKFEEAGKPYRFQPGISGNPAGRPKGGLSKVLRQLLAQNVGKSKHQIAELVCRAIVKATLKGDAAMARLLFERTDGKLGIDLGDFGSGDVEVIPPKIVVNFVTVKKEGNPGELPAPQISIKPPLPPEESDKAVIQMPKKEAVG
jgi:Family of unknown function (DUF5681)